MYKKTWAGVVVLASAFGYVGLLQAGGLTDLTGGATGAIRSGVQDQVDEVMNGAGLAPEKSSETTPAEPSGESAASEDDTVEEAAKSKTAAEPSGESAASEDGAVEEAAKSETAAEPSSESAASEEVAAEEAEPSSESAASTSDTVEAAAAKAETPAEPTNALTSEAGDMKKSSLGDAASDRVKDEAKKTLLKGMFQ